MSQATQSAKLLREELDRKLAELLTQLQFRHYERISPHGR